MDEHIRTAKKRLRTEIRQWRRQLVDQPERSQQIWLALEPLLTDRAAEGAPLTVFAFRGVGGEPVTDPWIATMSASGYRVCLPRCEGQHMVAVAVDAQTQFVTSSFGIPEPGGPALDPASIDLVIVPGVAFTAHGQRLGQGGGYYDRFIPQLRPGCITIAVCFDEQVVASLPGETHDRPVDIVVTDQRLLRA